MSGVQGNHQPRFKAEAVIGGTTPTIRFGINKNVDSITKVSTGNYTVTWINSFNVNAAGDGKYAFQCTPFHKTAGDCYATPFELTAVDAKILFRDNAGGFVDPSYVTLSVLGGQYA